MAEESNKLQELSIDCVIFGFEDHQLKILLYQRAIEPEMDQWALPGGFIKIDEDLDRSASRILKEVTGVNNIYMQQINAFGAVNRYPQKRVITIGFYALINPGNYNIVPGVGAKAAQWFDIAQIPVLSFDHNEIYLYALNILRKKVRYEPIGFELLPEKFTLTLIQRLYEAVLGIEFDVRNFRKKLLKMNLLIKLPEKQEGVAHRAANLYKFDKKIYNELKGKGFMFDL
ncbi:NUDIX hydrolase [Fulvivirga sp. M361]|uniref:NUDIX hydrolase n=1 Tax=Fulvivirga sp. M361 TaxID=2594266 RepID=UPI00117AF773|nr:NUDIX domain-containing protein [Fulvivirga sp. M361]TRX62171.1 NUDIX hydrolase [Fulvivirga sp. M361]